MERPKLSLNRLVVVAIPFDFSLDGVVLRFGMCWVEK
jgi:hypothetical protein